MADDKSSSFSPMVILALVAAFGGMYFLQSALISSRPPSSSSEEASGHVLQDVQARLWQDPLETVRQYESGVTTNGVSSCSHSSKLSDLREAISFVVTNAESQKLLVLSVMVTGGPYADDHESRLKARYAAVSALGRAGYVSSDEYHIGYFVATNDSAQAVLPARKTDSITQPRVPFEWFKRSRLYKYDGKDRSLAYNKVLVLWLDNDVFDGSVGPIAQLGILAGQLGRTFDVLWQHENISFKVIGPADSTTLKDMMEDRANISSFVEGGFKNKVELYSYSASVADEILVTNASRQMFGSRRHIVRDQLSSSNGVIFCNVGCTDDELSKSLIEELKRRDVDIANTNNCVALVSEWDTFYGRALPLTFRAEAQLAQVRNDQYPLSAVLRAFARSRNWAQSATNIWQYSYLAGLDGTLPAPKQKERTGKQDDDQAEHADGLQRPEGDSQLDYIPRLATRLKERDRRWRVEHGARSGLKAIGVLGSDVYDKLLVLQALRPEFPGAIFFTTDMDARLLHPSQWKWTRNLIVASSFGLELNKQYQNQIPPFRDTYESAQFLATLMALGAAELDLSQIQPRILEVGRNGAFDLSPNRMNEATVYPEVHPFHITWKIWLWACGTAVFCLILVFPFIDDVRELVASLLWPCVRKDPQSNTAKWVARKLQGSRPWSRPLGFCVTVVVVISLALAIQHSNGAPDGEPWSLIDGVSLWPAECLRLLALLLGVYLLTKGKHDCDQSNQKLWEEFDLGVIDLKGFPARVGSCTGFCQKCKRYWRMKRRLWERIAFLHPLREALKPKSNTVDVRQLFRAYGKLGSTFNRAVRIVPIVVVYLLLFITLSLIFGLPSVPFRGSCSKTLDTCVMVLSVLALVALLFFVVDAARLCKKFIEILQEQPSTWPRELFESYGSDPEAENNPMIEWFDIQMIAKLTETVGQLVIYPFIVIFIMIIARNSFFDDWNWPLPLILVFVANGAYAIYSGIMLRRAAEAAREKAVDSLNKKLFKAQEELSAKAEKVRMTMEQIKTIQKGTFAPWSSHPLVGAILIPFGGSGLMALLQYLAQRP